jgi:hypothetical protein
MMSLMAATAALTVLLMTPAVGLAQRSGSETMGNTGRLDPGVTRLPERPDSGPRHRDATLPPESYVPRRSPDLGQSSFPLSPSIGPGSGLLGPEAGRGPGRLRSGAPAGSTPDGGSGGR